MPRVSSALHALNVGEVSRLSLARVDLERMRLAAEDQVNFLPQVLGPAMLRPGTRFLGSTRNDATARLVPFVFSASVTAALELTDQAMRVLVDGQPVTYPAVTASVGALTDFADASEAGASATFDGSVMVLTGSGANAAIRTRSVTVNEVGVEHALRVTVGRGPVTLRVGSTAGDDDLVRETTLRTGTHFLAFTPGGSAFDITVSSRAPVPRRVNEIVISTGTLVVPTPWTTGDLPNIRFDQSGDVLFVACEGRQQRRIERRSQRSWSVALYQVDDGPFRLPNTTATTLTPSAVSGTVTLTASRPVFRAGHVGALFRMTHSGQFAIETLAGEDQSTNPIRVSGLTAVRSFLVELIGTFSATVTLQRSISEPGSWTDVASYTSPTTISFNDALDNQIIFYRLTIKAGDYTSGSVSARLFYEQSIQTGVCRVLSVASPTSATAEVLRTFARPQATTDWDEGAWSTERGWPSSVVFHDGRLWWGARDTLYGSISDAFESFDDEQEGDSGPITRSVATGPFEGIRWLLSLQRLMAGTASQEVSIRSSSFDEPLTPTAFTARAASRRGCANLAAVGVDSQGVFVQRDRKRVFEMAFSVEDQDYVTRDLTRLKPEMCAPAVVDLAIQRQPDTRIWCVLSDGRCAVLTYERSDEVVAWTPVETTGGAFESVCVLPGQDEDDVLFVVRRTIGGVTRRYIERLAKQSEARGGTINRVADCHVTYQGAATAAITGLGHLEGRQVVVWGNGAPLVTHGAMVTVSGGAITLPSAVTSAVVGLPYQGRFRSTKLAYGAALGTAVSQAKRVDRVGLVMADIGWRGVRLGRSFSELRGLSPNYRGKTLADNAVLADYDDYPEAFSGTWGPDERICIEASAPYPCTLLGVVLHIQTNDAG